MNLTRKLSQVLLLIMALSVWSCTDDDDDTLGVWYRKSDFDGRSREDAAGFVIGNYGYICGGYRGKTQRERDCWEYNIASDWWTQCADLPTTADARNGAVGFSVGSKGYITNGYTVYSDDDPVNSGGSAYLSDTWEYDPATDSWTKMDDYPGTARRGAVSFTIGQYAYVGTGYAKDDKQLKDFYKFDPTQASGSQWTLLQGFGGQKREGAQAFVINDIAYLVGGINNGADVEDFWSFDPTQSDENKWIRLRDIKDSNSSEKYDDDYTSIMRAYGCAFVIDGQGFITLGQTAGGGLRSNYWIYDPATDLWRSSETEDYDYTAFEGSSRVKAICFSTGQRGIITTGGAGSTSYYDDTWELKPYEWEED